MDSYNYARRHLQNTNWTTKLLILIMFLLSGMTLSIIIFNNIKIMVSLKYDLI